MESHSVLCMLLVISFIFYTASAADEIVCPEIECMAESCSHGFQKDERGCRTCQCLAAECTGFNCEEGKDCRVFHDTKSDSRMPDCIDISLPSGCQAPMDVGPCRARIIKWFYDTDSGTCQEFNYGGCRGNHNRFESRDECLQGCERCATLNCDLKCAYGYERAEDGCKICKCRADQEKSAYDGKTDPAVFRVLPGCDMSGETECDLHCPNGFSKDESGCHICHCLPPPSCTILKCDVTCEHGYREDGNTCPTCECREKGECSKIDCYMYCEFGRKLDTYGCPHCQCKEDPCEVIDCPDGKQCHVFNRTRPECVALVPQWIDGCPSIMCAMYCELGYISDRYGCNICKCKTTRSPECPLTECVPCEPDFGYVYTEYGCRTCDCHKDPCLDHNCHRQKTQVCVAERQCQTCATRPVCVSKDEVRSVKVHMELTCSALPQDFNKDVFLEDIKKQLSKRVNIDEGYFVTFKVSEPKDLVLDVDFHLVDDNGDPAELHDAVSTLTGAQQFEYDQTAFSSDPAAYSSAFYKTAQAGPGDTGESKEGQTMYIIIGCVVGGLVALMIGIFIAFMVTKSSKNKARRPKRKHNVIYQPTTYEDNA